MKKQLLTLLTLLLCAVSGVWADEVTVTLSGVSTKDAKGSTSVPSGIAASATITTGACGSSCDPATYHITSGDDKKIGSYWKVHPYEGTTKLNWSSVKSITLYGTFTVPAGYTYKITKVTHQMQAEGTNDIDANIVVKNATSVAQYTSSKIDVSTDALGGPTNINIAEGDQVTLVAGTYTLNVIATLASGSGKYFGFTQIVLTGDLETAGIDTASPSITTDLDDENAYTAYLGVEKTLSIEAAHYTGYQWYSCTNAAGDGASAIDGATSYAYAFTPDATGTYYYKCVVTNDNATGTKTATSKVATVNVEAQTPVFSLTKSSIAVGGTSQIIVGSKAGLDGLTMTGLTYDDAVISISATGAITALAKGTSTITFTTAASGNYAAGSANLSITVTGKVVASSTPNSWTGATSRAWSVSKIAFGGAGEEGDNGLYFKTGTSNSIDYSSGDYFSLKEGNIMYLEVPSATSTGIVTVKSSQNNADRYLQVVNSEGTQNLTMSSSGNSVRFDAYSIETIDEKHYIKLARGAGECKIAVSNFATVTLDATVTIGSTGYTTFASSYPLNISGMTASTGTVKAYYVTASDVKSSSVALTDLSGNVAAGTGLILEGTADATITIPVVASGTSYTSTNMLVGCTANTDITASTENYENFYVLSATEAAFKKIKNWVDTPHTLTIPAGKAYLDTTGADVVGAPSLTFDLGGEATGIADVRGKMEDVRGDFFDLQGRKVAQPTKGLYILNGKKMVIK